MTADQTNSNEKAKKPKKKKGPIRTGAIVPFLIIMGLLTAYYILFLDAHLRRGLEWAGTYLNGAEVNVAAVDLDLAAPSLEILGVQVTNPSEPTRNTFEVGRIGVRLLWDALLRAKFVTEEAGITDIAANTPRKSPGRVLTGAEKAASDAMKRKVAEMAKERLKNSDLARIPEIIRDLNPAEVLKDLKSLKSREYVEDLEKQLAQKGQEWQTMLTTIPGAEQAEQIQKRVAAIQGGGNNPAEIKKKIEQAQAVIKDADAALNEAKQRRTNLTSDVTGVGPAVGKIDDLIRMDRQELMEKLKLPEIDTSGLTKQLFGLPSVEKLASVEKFTNLARKYIPPKSERAAKPEPITPPERRSGKVYQFGIPKAYPLYWIKRAEISSKVGPSEYSGNLDGELLNLVSDQTAIGQPTVLNVRGAFPKQNITGVIVNVVLDHRTEVPSDTFKLTIGQFPLVGERVLAPGPALRFAMLDGMGHSELTAGIVGDRVKFSLNNRFEKVDYQIGGESEWLSALFKDVVRDLPALTLNVSAEGTWKDLKIGFDSNLGSALQSALNRQLQGKLTEARAKVDRLVDEQVGQRARAVKAGYEKTRAQVTAEADARVKQLEQARAQAVAKVENLKKQATGAAKRRAEEAKKKLKGKLPKF